MKTRALFTTGIAGLAAAVALSASVGCVDVPAEVDGVVKGDGFTLRCTEPFSKPASGRDTLVVLAEHDTETLRTVSITLKNAPDLPLHQPLAMGDGHDDLSSVLVGVGALRTEMRDDGVEVISSENNVFSHSTGGTLTLDERNEDEISGTFHVELDDGGYLEGVFTAFPE